MNKKMVTFTRYKNKVKRCQKMCNNVYLLYEWGNECSMVGIYTIVSIVLISIFFVFRRNNDKYKHIFFMFTNIVMVVYLFWRITTVPIVGGFPLVIGGFLFIAELFRITKFFMFGFLSYYKNYIEDANYSKGDMEDYHTVDIFISVFNESIDLIRKSIVGCKNIEYNQDKVNIYICHNGKSKEIKDLAEEYNINYLERSGEDKGKAVNLNNALSKTQGDIVVMIDANMIPKKHLLKETVKYFYNNKIGYIQIIKEYSNNKYIGKINRKSIAENTEFVTKSGTALTHNVINTIFRRSAIEKVGGVPTFALDEDIALGLNMDMEGYNGICVSKALMINISVVKAKLFIERIERWAVGAIQIMKTMKVYSNKKVSFRKKVAYTYGIFEWLDVLDKMLFILVLMLFMYRPSLIIDDSLYRITCYSIPFIFSQIIYYKLLIPQNKIIGYKRYFNITTYPYILKAVVLSLISNKYIEKKLCEKKSKEEQEAYNSEIVSMDLYIFLFVISLLVWIYLSNINEKLPVYYCYIGALIPSSIYIINLMTNIKSINSVEDEDIDEKVEIYNDVEIALTYNNKVLNGKALSISERGILVELEVCNDIEMYKSIPVTIKGQDIYGVVMGKDDNVIEIRFGDLSKEDYETILSIYIDNLRPNMCNS